MSTSKRCACRTPGRFNPVAAQPWGVQSHTAALHGTWGCLHANRQGQPSLLPGLHQELLPGFIAGPWLCPLCSGSAPADPKGRAQLDCRTDRAWQLHDPAASTSPESFQGIALSSQVLPPPKQHLGGQEDRHEPRASQGSPASHGCPQCPPAPERWHCPRLSRGPSQAGAQTGTSQAKSSSPVAQGCCRGTRRDTVVQAAPRPPKSGLSMRSQLLPSPRPGQELSPRSPPGLRRAKCREFMGPKCLRVCLLLRPLSSCTSCGSPALSSTANAPRSGSRRGTPGEGFRPRGQAWCLGKVMKPRAAHPYPDPDPPPSLGALPAAAGPEKGVRALDSHRHSAAASPGSSQEALRAQGAKQEAGTNGRTGGPG